METEYTTRGGVRVRCDAEPLPYPYDLTPLAEALDARRGAAARVELRVPGPLHALGHGLRRPAARARGARPRRSDVEALNARGAVLLPAVAARARAALARSSGSTSARRRRARAPCARRPGASPRRSAAGSRRSSRCCAPLVDALRERRRRAAPRPLRRLRLRPRLPVRADPRSRLRAPADQRDLVLYLPDELVVVDHRARCAQRRRYDFEADGRADRGPARASGARRARTPAPPRAPRARRPRARRVRGRRARAREALQARRPLRGRARPDLLRAVPARRPSELFRRLRERNPAPYGFLDQPRRRRVPGRRLARDVRARRRRPRRDLPDLGHDRARPRRASTTPRRSWRCSTRPRTSPS